ncbi:MAG: 3-oxoacyl-[acyl-carrier protein] reductase [Verrucomicrobiota bacterium]|jgi:3-oxoacyl-[acyl-carrier protein] reductase|nr:3-oxoacyl-[acyl-carrier protein] reductase [Verrucomicrobiota bacterium]
MKTTHLIGKIALVTGASRGIGRAVALSLAAAGADVAINFRVAREEADSLADEIEKLGRRCLTIQADVSKGPEVERLVSAVQTELGPVSVLVNNAGIARLQPLEEITEVDWGEVVDVNLKSAFLMIQACLPDFRRQKWGRIVNISSVAAQLGGIVGPHYAASKAGLHGLTHYYARALAKEGITANSVAPALIETDMIADNPAATPDLIPIGRIGQVQEVADVVMLAVSNGYLTGQTLSVNGGLYMT